MVEWEMKSDTDIYAQQCLQWCKMSDEYKTSYIKLPGVNLSPKISNYSRAGMQKLYGQKNSKLNCKYLSDMLSWVQATWPGHGMGNSNLVEIYINWEKLMGLATRYVSKNLTRPKRIRVKLSYKTIHTC